MSINLLIYLFFFDAKFEIIRLEKNMIKPPNNVDKLGISSNKKKAKIEIIGNLKKSYGAK